nr:hypothetical protein HmN_000219400 [Hymenolepis microstoma]
MDNERPERPEEISTTSSGAGHERSSSPSFFGHDPFDIEEGKAIVPSSQRLDIVGTRTQDTIPARMASENPIPDNNLSMGGVQYTPYRYYYTLVLRNYGKVPTSISCLYVEHEQHMHVLLQAKDNISRKVDRLLNDCLVPADNWWMIKNTRQLVRNVYLIIQYFKYRGVVFEVGTELHEEWQQAQDMPPIQPHVTCDSELRRARTKSTIAERTESRHTKFTNLLDELKRSDIRQFEEIFSAFSVNEIWINMDKKTTKVNRDSQQIQSLNAERLQSEKQNSYLQNLQMMKHDCTVKHPREVDIGYWILLLIIILLFT